MRGHLDAPFARRLIDQLGQVGLGICFYPMLSWRTLALTRHPKVRGTIFIDQSSKPIPVRHHLKHWLVRWRGAVGGRCYRRVITVSDYNKRKLEQRLGIPASRIRRIYNGVDLSRFATLKPCRPDSPILYVGQMEPYKGVETLLQAYQLLRLSQSDCPPLRLVGAGSIYDRLKKETSSALHTGIELLGLRDDAPNLMMSSSCIVIPSEWEEACAFVAIEAMASGRPAIISDAGSLPELFDDGATIFPRGNTTKLADALGATLSRVNVEGTVGLEAARLRSRAFNEFDMDQMVIAYAREIRNLFG